MTRWEQLFQDTINYLPANITGSALDIGACDGLYSLLFAKKFKMAYAVEPFPPSCDAIDKACQQYQVPNVYIENAAISNVDGPVRLTLGGGRTGNTTNPHMKWDDWELYNHSEFLIVEGITLDTFCRDKDIRFIKCDIEGAEDFVFGPECAKETLSKSGLIIALETHKEINHQKLFETFRSYGFDQVLTDGFTFVDHFEGQNHYLITRQRDITFARQ